MARGCTIDARIGQVTEHSSIKSVIEKASEARVNGDLDELMSYSIPIAVSS